jgi:hypothetical protein
MLGARRHVEKQFTGIAHFRVVRGKEDVAYFFTYRGPSGFT